MPLQDKELNRRLTALENRLKKLQNCASAGTGSNVVPPSNPQPLPHEKQIHEDGREVKKLISKPSPNIYLNIPAQNGTLAWLTKYKPLIDFAGLIVLFVYTFFTVFLWHSSLEANQLIKQNNITSQRPWVGASLPLLNDRNIFEDEGADKRLRWMITFKNFGNSPALRTQWHMRLSVLPIPVPSSADPKGYEADWQLARKSIEQLPMDDFMEDTIFNGETAPNGGVANAPFGKEIYDKIKARELTVILGGRVNYFDEFGKEHETTVCVIYLPEGDGRPASWLGCPIFTLAT